ncbi:MAG: hypothetical protein KGH69_01200 [Candidatus Micrarchaeota archaeon]|nr:hypothetical protein [Candidatus Micrarchaeota archaeon]
MKAFLAVAIAALLLSGISFAKYLDIQGPVSGTLYDNGTIALGSVGPGESFYVSASATTTNASGATVNIGWDTLEALNSSLPAGWTAQASPLYENPMKMKITTAPDTPNGVYTIAIRAINVQNYSKLGNLTINAKVNVTQKVVNFSAEPTRISVGTGQPISIKVTINNTGISDDPFYIAAVGLPAWNVSDQVIALHSTKGTYVYPVYVNEPGTYDFNMTVSSSTSPLIRSSFPIRMVAQASLLNDYSAVGQGVVLSPVIFQPSYSLMLLISDVYKALTNH